MMTNTSSLLVVLSTFPGATLARETARTLVTERLAACANIVPGVESIYRWMGEVEQEGECLVVFKTTREAYPAFEARLASLHPHDVPEIVALPAERVLEAYSSWAADAVDVAKRL